MKKKGIIIVLAIVAVLLFLAGCTSGGGGTPSDSSSTSGGTPTVTYNPFKSAVTGNDDVRTLTIANLDKIFSAEWPKVVRVAIGENVGLSVLENAILPNGTSVTFQVVGSGQASFELYGLDASGAKVYIWTKNPDMKPWFHTLRGFNRIGLAIATNGAVSPLPYGIFTVPRVFKVDVDGKCFMASWALACERSIANIQTVSVTYWDGSGGGPWNGLGLSTDHLEDEWIQVIPRLEDGDTKVRIVADLIGGGTAEGRVFFLRQIGSTDVHPTEDLFLAKSQDQGNTPAVPKVEINISEASGYTPKEIMVFADSKVLVSVETINAYTPTFWLNNQNVTDKFGDLVEDKLWAANLAVAEGAYTLTVRFFNNRGAKGTAEKKFRVILPTQTLEIARGSLLPYVNGNAGSIDLATGVVRVAADGGTSWHVQLRYPLSDGFLQPGYFYRVQGAMGSAAKVGGKPLTPRFQMRENLATNRTYDSLNAACDGWLSFDFEPVFDAAGGMNGNGASFLIQFGAAGAGSYQLPSKITIKKVPMP